MNSSKNLDRFIPNRSAMDFGYAHYMLTTPNKGNKGKENLSANSQAYRKKLSDAADLPSRILAFGNKRPKPENSLSTSPPSKRQKLHRHIPTMSQRSLGAPGILNDFCLNLLDWSCTDFLSLAIRDTVYIWNSSDSTKFHFIDVYEEDGPVTSVNWAPDGRHIALGLNNSFVQIWDVETDTMLRTLMRGHRARVGSIDWNGSILTTGGGDGKIVNHDVRMISHVVGTYRGHKKEVCGLKWSLDGKKLASGGNDNVVHIWDNRSAVSSHSRSVRWLHKFEEHAAVVKALAWCPFQSSLLASGGGEGDQCIKLWNVSTGARLNSVDTGSEISALIWNNNERELLSSHGLSQNELTLWKYPSMLKMAELEGHTSRVLHMSQSPDGSTVASVSADETVKFWNVFGAPLTVPKSFNEPFASFNSIR